MIAAACLLVALAAPQNAPPGAAPAAPASADSALEAPAPATPASADSASLVPASADPATVAAAPATPAAAEAVSPAPPSPSGGPRLFETWSLGMDAGIYLPAGSLSDVLDPAPLLGFRLETSYYGPWRAWASLDLARLDGEASPAVVGMATGATGLAWRPPSAWIPSPGIGLAYHYARALGKDAAADEYLFLEDGESEFGARAALRWALPFGKSLDLSAGARWETMFTGPDFGHAFAIHLGAAWKRR